MHGGDKHILGTKGTKSNMLDTTSGLVSGAKTYSLRSESKVTTGRLASGSNAMMRSSSKGDGDLLTTTSSFTSTFVTGATTSGVCNYTPKQG